MTTEELLQELEGLALESNAWSDLYAYAKEKAAEVFSITNERPTDIWDCIARDCAFNRDRRRIAMCEMLLRELPKLDK